MHINRMYGTSDNHKVFSSQNATLDKLGLGSAEARADQAMCALYTPLSLKGHRF